MTVGFHLITHILKMRAREILIDRFDLLQQRHVGLGLIEPISQGLNAGFDPIDIECRYFHEIYRNR